MFNHGAVIGEQARTGSHDELLGTITASYFEGSVHWLQINDTYELAVQSCEVVIDLPKGVQYIRVKGF